MFYEFTSKGKRSPDAPLLLLLLFSFRHRFPRHIWFFFCFFHPCAYVIICNHMECERYRKEQHSSRLVYIETSWPFSLTAFSFSFEKLTKNLVVDTWIRQHSAADFLSLSLSIFSCSSLRAHAFANRERKKNIKNACLIRLDESAEPVIPFREIQIFHPALFFLSISKTRDNKVTHCPL